MTLPLDRCAVAFVPAVALIASCGSDGGSNRGSVDAASVDPIGAVSHIDAEMRGLCPDGAFSIGDAAAWADFVSTCVTSAGDPIVGVDWELYQVVGIQSYVSCPFDPATIYLGARQLGRKLDVYVWAWPDYCWCDYFDSVIHAFVVERGSVNELAVTVERESECEDVTCLCDGDPTPACSVVDRCETDWESYPQVDGVPPAPWP